MGDTVIQKLWVEKRQIQGRLRPALIAFASKDVLGRFSGSVHPHCQQFDVFKYGFSNLRAYRS